MDRHQWVEISPGYAEGDGATEYELQSFLAKRHPRVLIYIGADWCKPCQKLLPLIRGYYEENKFNYPIAIIKHSLFNQEYLQDSEFIMPEVAESFQGKIPIVIELRLEQQKYVFCKAARQWDPIREMMNSE